MAGQRELCGRNRALALVVQLSRIAGVAPLVFTESGPRVSLALSIYGWLFSAVNCGLTIWFSIYRRHHQVVVKNDTIYNTKTTQIVMEWLAYSVMIANIILVSLSAGRMKSLIEIGKRVKMVQTKFDTNPSGEVNNNRERQMIVLLYISFALFFTVETYCDIQYISISKAETYVVVRVTEFMLYLILSLTSVQVVFTCRHIGSLFPSYNERLRHLLESIEDKKPTDPVAFRRYGKKSQFPSQRIYVSPRSLNIAIDRIGMFPSPKSCHVLDAAETMRDLSVVYTEMCALVDIMNNHRNAVTIIVVLIIHSINLIASLYQAVNKFSSTPLSIILLSIEAYWFMHHFTHICLIVDCGHRLIYETVEIKRTVSKIMGKAVFIKDECVHELNKFFFKLMVMEPTLFPLSVHTLSRGLIISILGAAATYSVIVVQFRSSEL